MALVYTPRAETSWADGGATAAVGRRAEDSAGGGDGRRPVVGGGHRRGGDAFRLWGKPTPADQSETVDFS